MKRSDTSRMLRGRWRMRSIFVRTLAMLCLLVMVPLVGIIGVTSFSLNNNRDREVLKICMDATENVRRRWDRLCEEYDQIHSYIGYDPEVELFFYDWNQEHKFYSAASLKKMVQMPVVLHRHASNAYVFSADFAYMVTATGITRKQYSAELDILQQTERLVQQGVRVSTAVDPNGMPCVLMHRDFTSGRVKGIFLIKYNAASLRDYFQFEEPGDFFVTDGNQVLVSSRRELIGSDLSALDDYGASYIQYSTPATRSRDLTVTVFLDKNRIEMPQDVMGSTMLLFIASMFCVTLILALWITNKLYSPFREILALLRENGGFSEENIFGSKDELEFIIRSINKKRYFDEDAGQEMSKRLELLKKAQAVALQAQINPHFINNTLETISFIAIAQLGRDNEVSRMVKALASMLRTTLGSVEALVPLSEEIRHCEQYLSIQNIRYADKFETHWDVDPELRDCRIIRITLQPLVENAIYHGIKHLSKPGRLDIGIHREGEQLYIQVRDNGLGMTEEKLREITQRMQADMIQQSSHIGLANVYQRLKLFYGEECSLTIRSVLGEGTSISLRLPIR